MASDFALLCPFLLLTTALYACSSRPATGSQEAAQTLEDLTFSQTNNGVVQWILHSPRGIVEDQAGLVELTTPQIEMFKEGRPAGNVRSEAGILHEQSGDIHMSGNVVVISSEDASSLKTEALDYVGAKSQFQTDMPVVIRRPSGVMRGRGMIANHDLSEIHVLHQESTLQ